MKNDIDLAQACSDIYDDTTIWMHRFNYNSVFGGARTTPDGDIVIAFRGSDCIEDWYHDFIALPILTPYGHVHDGFYDGLPETYEELFPTLSGQAPGTVYIGGHSLGADHAYMFGAMLIKNGFNPAAVVAFAPAKPGYQDFASILYTSKVGIRGYHNQGDPVPDVPDLPLEPYVQPILLTPLKVAPAEDDLSPLRCHHIELYLQGVTNLLKGVTNA